MTHCIIALVQAGVSSGGFRDDRTSRCQRRCHFLHHQIDREIPRAEGGNGSDRLFQHQRTLAGGTNQYPAIAALGFLGEIIECRGAGGYLCARLGKRFALLGGEQHGGILGAFADQFGDLVQNRGALVDLHRAPLREAFGRSFDRFVEIGCGRKR